MEKIERIAELVRRAFAVATAGRTGPVVLDIPEDVCHGEASVAGEDIYADPAAVAVPAMRCRPDADAIAPAAALIQAAE